MIDDKFINPYNFVRPDKNVLRKNSEFINFTKFYPNLYSGQIAISIKSVDNIPIFTPDSQQKKYWIILDDNIEFKGVDQNKDIDKEYNFKIEDRKLEKCDNLPEIKPLSDYENSNELLKALKERAKWTKGKLKEICNDAEEKNKIRYIETDDPGDYEDKAHEIMEFCKDPEGNPILPSTTLKGLIRNTIEILSNSCFSFYDKKQIYYRLNPDSGRREISDLSKYTYIVKKIDPNGTAEAVKLDSVKVNTSFFIEDELRKGNPVWAAVVFDYSGNPEYIKKISKEGAVKSCIEGLNRYFHRTRKNLTAKSIRITSRNILNDRSAPFSYEATISIRSISVKYFEPRLKDVRDQFLYARVQRKMVGPRRNFIKYYLQEINDNKAKLSSCDTGETIVQCKLKKSGEIETKTQDILFFKYGQQNLLNFINQAPIKKIEKRIIDEYSEILKQRKFNLKEKGRYEPESLKEGDLFFYNEIEEYISYTQIPRKKYNNSINNIIKNDPEITEICRDVYHLCPACNMFGSTELIEKKNDKKKKIAVSGKVSFGLGKLINSSAKLEKPAPLKILSSPKPSCTYFYLINGDYNSNNSKIRGRKLYYHHSKDNLNYQRGAGDSKDNVIIDNHNVSIEALKNFEFKSTLDFINLSKYELGLLLFALNLLNKEGGKLYHKLGMGKPLGLGTVKIDIDGESSFLIDRQKRYSTFLTSNGEMETGKESLNISEFVEVFKMEQIKIYNKDKNSNEKKSDFYEISYISDLFNILEINSLIGDYPEIKYPRRTENNEPRGFEWFVKEQQKKSPPQNLPLPSEAKSKTRTLNGWT